MHIKTARAVRRMATLAAVAIGTTALAVPATAGAEPIRIIEPAPNPTSLATALTSDGDRFDGDRLDYDILTELALYVLEQKPESRVGVITEADTPVTVFAPLDVAFQELVSGSHDNLLSERETYDAIVSTNSVRRIEKILLYHVVPGQTLYRSDLSSNLGRYRTALPRRSVLVAGNPFLLSVKDRDPSTDWAVFQNLSTAFDVNGYNLDSDGNRESTNVQIAQGLDQVLSYRR